jgi:c-di-GMP-related signal transduction protein
MISIENIILNFYVAHLSILKKNIFASELLHQDRLKNINEAAAKIIEELGCILRLKRLTQGSLVFINFDHDSLINFHYLTSEQHFKETITVLEPLPSSMSPSEKIVIHANFQHPLSIGVMKSEAVSGIREC